MGVRALCERATADMRCRIRILDLGFESIFGQGQGLCAQGTNRRFELWDAQET